MIRDRREDLVDDESGELEPSRPVKLTQGDIFLGATSESRLATRAIAKSSPGIPERQETLAGEIVKEISSGQLEKSLSGSPRARDGTAWTVSAVADKLAKAADFYARDRYGDAMRVLTRLKAKIKDLPALDELHALTLYRMGKWAQAARELEDLSARTGSFDQHPVLMDCHRALDNVDRVGELFEELRHSSPTPEVMAEGRVVFANTLADHGEIDRAISILSRSGKSIKNPRQFHVRQWYCLACLYEKKGDLSRAANLFRTALGSGLYCYDASERLLEIS